MHKSHTYELLKLLIKNVRKMYVLAQLFASHTRTTSL